MVFPLEFKFSWLKAIRCVGLLMVISTNFWIELLFTFFMPISFFID